MKLSRSRVAVALAVAAIGAGAGGNALAAGAIISNGTLILGINDTGNLNVQSFDTLIAGSRVFPATSGGGTSPVGLRFIPAAPPGGNASTEPGCLCEGWGAGIDNLIDSLKVSGWANRSDGSGTPVSSTLSVVSFTTNGTSATSVVDILGATGAAALRVTHEYAPLAATPNLYQVTVSINNRSGSDIAAGDLRYRRVMDWDIEPTAFDEFVTIQGVPAALGVANGNNVRFTGNDGFETGDPLRFTQGRPKAGTIEVDNCTGENMASTNFTDCGVGDHGALFDFEFEALANGATRQFQIFYGAAATEALADEARALVNGDPNDIEIGLYSYGQCDPASSTACSLTAGTPNTFIFGFGASGGRLEPPPPPNGDVPVPGTLALAGLGLAALAALRRRRYA